MADATGTGTLEVGEHTLDGQWAVDFSEDRYDSTTFEDRGWRTTVEGLKGWTGTFTPDDASVLAHLEAHIALNYEAVLSVDPEVAQAKVGLESVVGTSVSFKGLSPWPLAES